MRNKCAVSLVGVGLSAIMGLAVSVPLAGAAPAEVASPKCAYVGVAGCRMCHNSKKQGEQVVIWQGTQHAKAFETLKSDAAIKLAGEKGLKTAPSESPECLRCHVTGWNLSEEQRAKFLKPAFKIEDGVQCETCHGPGDDYKSLKVMKDRQLALQAGLVIGDEKLCLSCHNDQAPSWNPERFTTKDGKKVGFDYAACWEKIKHPAPKEKAE